MYVIGEIYDEDHDLIEEYGLNLLIRYYIKVLGYKRGKSISDLNPGRLLENALKSYTGGYVMYETDNKEEESNNKKKLVGFLLTSEHQFERHENIQIICGIDIRTVQKLLRRLMVFQNRFDDVHITYYFPQNDELEILFEEYGFKLIEVREPLFRKDHRIMILKYIKGNLLIN